MCQCVCLCVEVVVGGEGVLHLWCQLMHVFERFFIISIMFFTLFFLLLSITPPSSVTDISAQVLEQLDYLH